MSKNASRRLLRALAIAAALVAAHSAELGCGDNEASSPHTSFQIAPQGGTITGVYGSGAIVGGSNGGVVTLSLGDCPAGSAWVSLGSGSGYACASAGTPSTAGSGELLVQGSGELAGYAGSACGSGLVVQSIDSAGDLGCALPIASNACSSGWANAIGSDGSLNCSTPTAAQVSGVEIAGSLATGNNNDWSPTGLSTATMIDATGTGTPVLTGIAAQPGRTITIVQASTVQFTILHNSSASSAGNRILTLQGVTQILPAGAGLYSITLTYDSTQAAWVQQAISTNHYDNNSLTVSSFAAAAITATGSIPSTNTFGAGWTVDNSGGGRDTYASQSGMSCGYATNASETCLYGATGYNNGTTQLRSWGFLDGEGSGSAHTIALFDAGTHGLFVGSGNTSAELTYSTGTLVDSGNLEINGNLQGDSDALIDGELTVQGGADVEGGNVTINTSGTSTTTIGNMSGNLTLTGNATTIAGSGNTTIDPDGELILDGQFSTILKAGSGAGSVYLEGVLQTSNTGVTAPTISNGTCASSICTNVGGTIAFTAATATVTFASGFYAHAPICTLGPMLKGSKTVYFSTGPTSTSFQVTEGTLNSGDEVSYICIGAG